MVAADDQRGHLPLGQTAEEIIKQSHRLGGGYTLVIHVTGDENCINLFLIDDAEDLGENIFLIFDHGYFIDPLTNVQVR